jgi:hypothetical protein
VQVGAVVRVLNKTRREVTEVRIARILVGGGDSGTTLALPAKL